MGLNKQKEKFQNRKSDQILKPFPTYIREFNTSKPLSSLCCIVPYLYSIKQREGTCRAPISGCTKNRAQRFR